jgi:hypothetical protein
LKLFHRACVCPAAAAGLLFAQPVEKGPILRIRFALFACALAASAPASAGEPTLQQSIPPSVLHDARDHVVNLVIENDSIGGSGTDDNYSSGVRVNYTEIRPQFPALARALGGLIPGFELNDSSALYYSLGQNIYTPENITSRTPDPNDRPWAAFLYGSMGMATIAGNHMDEVEATLGVVGPLALGEPVQKFVHRHLSGSPTPRGWAHQLRNEPGLMLAWQRSWPMLAHGTAGGTFWSVKPYAGVTAGNIRTYADAGFSIRLSPRDSIWQDTPLRVAPAMPGTGIYEIPPYKWSWELFAGLEGRAVARDIFLDGNSFADSPSVDKKYFVAEANGGAALTYDRYRISYTLVYRTKEFRTQEDPELFGAVSGSLRF